MKKNQPKKPQWSRGDAPGEYGGPPRDSRLRTTWRTSKPVDPLTATGAYIWKKDWQSFLEATTSADSEAGWDSAAAAAPDSKEKDSGFLSLNRAISLDSMDVDLSLQLMKPSKAAIQRQEEKAKRIQATGSNQSGRSKKLPWRLAPTRREEALWAKGRQAGTGGSEVMAREVKLSQIDKAAMAERQRIWYAELKRNLQLVTLGIGGVGTTCCYLVYSPEVALSYGFGLIGALAYIRMLEKSMDNLGAGTTAGAARQALGSPRLLIPLILTMLYNRWNTLLATEYGLMHLNLLPMLLGFFTYKAATLVETFKELLPVREDDAAS